MKKKFIAILMIAALAMSLMACGGSSEQDEKENQQSEISQNDVSSDTIDSDEEVVIELIAGEQGEYGSMITMSEGTDMEESFYVYYVPAGTYEVTNKGEYMTQISVYEGFSENTETGYDEYTSTGDIVLLDTEKTDTIKIPEGWFIEIQEPAHISLTLTDSE